jgi:hypothetical protein
LETARVEEHLLEACLEVLPVGRLHEALEVLGVLRGAEDGQPVARLGREMLTSLSHD